MTRWLQGVASACGALGLWSLALAQGGCGPRTAVEEGQALFADRGFSSAASNLFSCALCHEVGAASSRPLSGHTLRDVTARPSFWGGAVPTVTEAVSECLTSFMRSRPLDPSDRRGRALLEYLANLGDGTSEDAAPKPLTFVRNIVPVPSGDAARGESVYREGCQMCHGAVRTGAGRLDPEVALVPDDSLREHGSDPLFGARPITIEKVRHGKFFGIGGVMPPFALERLSEAQLGDLLAYLEGMGLPGN